MRLLPILLLCACGALTSPALRAGESAAALMAQGNAAFRDGSYSRAAGLYQRAQSLGADSARVSYNLGVAYYWSGRYADSARALRQASRDPRFAARAWYNMGLAYWAAGDRHSAQPCFEWASRFAADRALRALAEQALDDLYAGYPSPRAPRRDLVLEPRPGPKFFAALRYGTDDNVFRAPDAPYVDLARSGQPTVTPVKQSGSYYEGEVYAAWITRTRHGNIIRRTYDFSGTSYAAPELRAADSQSHRLAVSSDAVFGERGTRRLQTRWYFDRHSEVDYDPDSGAERVSGTGESLRDRFSYIGAGTRWEYEQALGSLIAGFSAGVERRDYDALVSVSEYDHTVMSAGTWLSTTFGERLSVSIGADRSRRDYDERLSRDANGAILSTNSPLLYDYLSVYADASYTFGRAAWVRLLLEDATRDDAFAGYNDYGRVRGRLSGGWRITRRVRVDGFVDYYDYDYPNAFAYDTPAGGARTLSELDARVSVRVNLWRNLWAYAGYDSTSLSSSDARYAYTRRGTPFGLQWEAHF